MIRFAYKKYLKKIKSDPWILLAYIFSMFFLLSIPSREVYSFPKLPRKQVIIRESNLSIPQRQQYPVKVTAVLVPNLTASSVIAVDVDSKAVIYMKNPNQRLLPASTTKMVTALVAMDNYEPEKIMTVSQPLRNGQVMSLYEGEQITVENLLYGLLVNSANDAAEVLAFAHPQGKSGFVKEMNDKVMSLGLWDTRFVNPTGFDDPNQYASVHDLAIIGAEIMANPKLKTMVATKNITITDVNNTYVHELKSINELLGNLPGIAGIKTGWTEQARECLVAYVDRGDKKVITAVLGSDDRFGETATLVEWIYANHEWQEIEMDFE